MSLKATSIHHINADKKLPYLKKQLYTSLNWCNNQFPYSKLDPEMKIRDFTCGDLKRYWDKLYITSSPSRKLSDLFWMCLPWARIKEELGEINILDTGCGSGNYGKRLLEWSNYNVSRYVGTDVKKNRNWEFLAQKYSNFRFFQCNTEVIFKNIPEGTTFFMTQSAIEHFDEDLLYFEHIKNYIMSYTQSVIQVHLFPSSSCLKLFPYHGIRQYIPRTVSLITKLFKDFSYSVLFRLGGKKCNHFHYEFITKPLLKRKSMLFKLGRKIGNHLHCEFITKLFLKRKEDLRDLKTQEYDTALFKAIKDDMESPQVSPGFFALIIHSYWNNRLF